MGISSLKATPGMIAATTSRAERLAAWLLAVILFVASAYFYQDPEWNGNSRLNLTRAIVEQGTFAIDAYHDAPGWATGDKAFFQGHYYSDKAIGASMMAVPVYLLLHGASHALDLALSPTLIKHVLTTAVMGSAFALCGLAMFSIARRILGNPWRAALPTLAVALGTMLWPYSAVFYGHIPAAAFLASTFAILFAVRMSEAGGTRRAWFWLGLCVSMAFLSDHTAALVIVGLAAYALYVLRKQTWAVKMRCAWPALPGILLPLLVFFAYNLVVYRSPVAFGYAYEVEERFQTIMGLGLMGIRLPTIGASYHITLDPKFGLFWLSPVLLLALVGFYDSFRRGRLRAEVALSFYSIAIIFAMNAASYLWYGGSAFGPRLMITALPFFIVPLALLPPGWTWALVTLGLVSAANMLIPLMGQVQYTRLEFKPDRGGFFVDGRLFEGFSLLYGYGLRQVASLARAGRSPWTLGTALGLPLWLSILALTAVISILVAALRRVTRTLDAAT
jgi:hypothetical protein